MNFQDGSSNFPGYLAPRYKGDLCAVCDSWSNDPKLKQTELPQALAQLSAGCKHLFDQSWHHGDIKPSNMLKMENPCRFDLSDFGDCKNEDKLRRILTKFLMLKKNNHSSENHPLAELLKQRINYKTTSELMGAHTLTYCREDNDINAISKALEKLEADYKEKPSEMEALVKTYSQIVLKILQAKDVYAFALSSLEMIMPKKEYTKNSDYWDEVTKELQTCRLDKNSSEIADSLKTMLDDPPVLSQNLNESLKSIEEYNARRLAAFENFRVYLSAFLTVT